ncbi:MAG: carbamoyl-phosphate synthase small subunit [Pseudomonadales bacterium 32-61-5]|uniref:glutamine-hydrolyzing carbamoyl-phosphate synthase small subunit n=1 Tax=Stutzerimonas stutzeri TaxID=316 RepID=UPI000BDCCF6E|nr:glutamine-hydrolyzing carbamoyl-phosphate synthase small subunit [Stutzerimonas stutzeri]MBF6623310.1 glutamine-hydrolyzing carbamoyl-phosphate synthase small subunit [Stutzerimonas stutzeri]MCQ4241597.1 glutamine-hydrolyzing carbamoyl-phosphate synthase small subunit [Stutzerimonas stutzeri]OYW93193.1 MAG: carbamoyl-phosphate synthase small subunit [Pseudomonadales bacterium 32-61-5]
MTKPAPTPAILALADGSIFRGESIGADGQTIGEVVFNTAMTGYQEILTDPSYAKQIVTLTYPHIGNTGTTPEDAESRQVWAAGLVIRDLPLLASNWRNKQPLDAYLKENGTVAIAGIDTRRLTRILREKGAQNGCILTGADATEEKALELARSFPGLKGMDLAKEVSVKERYEWRSGLWSLESDSHPEIPASELPYHVVAFDYGVKWNILRMLVARGCRITVLPAQTPASEALALNPDGIFLANGPGDPEPCDYAIKAIQEVLETDVPVFGICLGHQLLALASGATTVKMPSGHHGANHPVQDLETGVVMITSQNHGFCADETTLPANLRATHKSLFDGTLQGIERTDKAAFGFQGHPEASPGPCDVAPLFDRFISAMAARR